MHKQHGFSILTFFVFLLGVIVGVSIAAVVAFQVSKAPIPLVDKHTEPGQLRARAGWNPNDTLMQTTTSQTGQSSDGQSTQYPQGAEDPPAIATLSSGDERAIPSTAPATAEGSGDNANNAQGQQFFVQAGAFASASDAEQQRAKLAFGGTQATISKVTAAGQTLHRVRVGPYPTREAASTVLRNLVSSGVDATIVTAQ